MALEPRADATHERRLHPMSWLFALLTQLRHILFPLIFLVVFHQGETWELYAALGGLGVAVYSLIYSFGFRYRIAADELVVREGIFDRTERHIPFARIQNIVQKQNLLHRLFDVTELKLESAGGIKPEATMSVLRRADAQELEAILRRHQHTAEAAGDNSQSHDNADQCLHEMSLVEVLKLGVISNRGMLLVGSLIAAWTQVSDNYSGRFFKGVGQEAKQMMGGFTNDSQTWLAVAGSVLAVLLAAMIVLRLFSIALALLQFYGFRLTQHGARLATQAGLLSRFQASARRQRIQLLDRHSTWLSRWFNRESIRVDVSGGVAAVNDEHARLKWLAPLADPAKTDELVQMALPGFDVALMDWRPLHRRAWIRYARPRVAFWVLIALVGTWFNPAALAVLLMAVWSGFSAWKWAQHSRYAVNRQFLVWQSGWLTRHMLVVELDKVQVVRLQTSPFDRRAAMADLVVDTMGANPLGAALSIPYLPVAQARALAVILGRHAANH